MTEVIERKAVVQVLRQFRGREGSWYTAQKRVFKRSGVYDIVNLEFTGRDRVSRALHEAREMAAVDPESSYRVIEVVTKVHDRFGRVVPDRTVADKV